MVSIYKGAVVLRMTCDIKGGTSQWKQYSMLSISLLHVIIFTKGLTILYA